MGSTIILKLLTSLVSVSFASVSCQCPTPQPQGGYYMPCDPNGPNICVHPDTLCSAVTDTEEIYYMCSCEYLANPNDECTACEFAFDGPCYPQYANTNCRVGQCCDYDGYQGVCRSSTVSLAGLCPPACTSTDGCPNNLSCIGGYCGCDESATFDGNTCQCPGVGQYQREPPLCFCPIHSGPIELPCSCPTGYTYHSMKCSVR